MNDEERPSEEYIELLRSYTEGEDSDNRRYGIGQLCAYGLVSWEDIEKWVLDADEDVRRRVISAIEGSGAACELRRTDEARAIALLEKTIARYVDYSASHALLWISQESDQMLELTWAAADRLQRLENQDIYTAILVGYFEDVITGNNWGPDDPHIRPWIENLDVVGRSTLFNVAWWNGLGDGRLREIMETLARDSDPETASAAKKLLDRNEPKDQPLPERQVRDQKKPTKGRKPGKPRWTESDKEQKHGN